MKEVKVFLRPERLMEVVKELKKAGFCCLTVFEGEGTGNFVDPKKTWPSLSHPFLHCKIEKIEIIVSSNEVEKVINIVHEFGKTGHHGDGLIYITDISKAVRVKDLTSNNLQMH